MTDVWTYEQLADMIKRLGGVSYPPGSHVPKLVQAAKDYVKADMAYEDARDSEGGLSAKALDCALEVGVARTSLLQAARKIT